MDFGYTKEEEEFRQKLCKFLDENLTEEIARENWEDLGLKETGREFAKKMAANGFLGMSWPKEYGGQALPPNYEFILLDEMGMRWGAHVPNDIGYTMVGHTILRRGSEALKKELLPGIVAGELEFCLGYSEPNAGSDLASLKMKAVEDGDDYIINGQKTFNTECHYSDYHWLAVRTDSDPSKPAYRGISLFVVDQNAPGIDIRPMICMSGEQTNEVYYEDVRVPKSRMVGEVNKGFYYVMEALGSERNQVFVPSRLRPILNHIITYAKNTEFNGKPLSEDPTTRAQIAEAAMEIEVAEMLAGHSRWMELTEQKMSHEPELCKVFTSELQQRIANMGMDVLGMYSQLEEGSKHAPEDGRIEWHWLHSFVCTLGGGTSEIGRNIIATRGLGLPR